MFQQGHDGCGCRVGSVFDCNHDRFVDDLVVEVGHVEVCDATLRLFEIV